MTETLTPTGEVESFGGRFPCPTKQAGLTLAKHASQRHVGAVSQLAGLGPLDCVPPLALASPLRSGLLSKE
jgi:hypothetical protein